MLKINSKACCSVIWTVFISFACHSHAFILEKNSWKLEQLDLAGSPSDHSAVILDFSNFAESIMRISFEIEDAELQLQLGQGVFFEIFRNGHELNTYVYDLENLREEFSFSLADEGSLRFEIDVMDGRIFLGEMAVANSTWLEEALLEAAFHWITFSNHGDSGLLINDLFITLQSENTIEPVLDGPSPNEFGGGDNSFSSPAEKPRRNGHPRELPPPHPWLAMDEQRRLLIAPGKVAEKQEGSLHRRPGIVPAEISREIVRKNSLTENP